MNIRRVALYVALSLAVVVVGIAGFLLYKYLTLEPLDSDTKKYLDEEREFWRLQRL